MTAMDWLGWLLLVLALVAVFALWDMIFCGGRRCGQLIDRFQRRDRPGGDP